MTQDKGSVIRILFLIFFFVFLRHTPLDKREKAWFRLLKMHTLTQKTF